MKKKNNSGVSKVISILFISLYGNSFTCEEGVAQLLEQHDNYSVCSENLSKYV
jgi:hypothetical protein